MSTAPELTHLRPTWADIDLDAFRRNLDAVHRMLTPSANLAAVLKADGYGHGAIELARVCEEASVSMIAVSLLEEALELRDAGITLPILILGPLTAAQVRLAQAASVIPGVVGPEELRGICEGAEGRISIHMKLDSGMGRMGFIDSDLADAVALLRAHPDVEVDGVYTHFASASDSTDPMTAEQLAAFDRMVSVLEAAGIRPALRHTSNSAGTFRHIERAGELARVGIALYGASPFDDGTQRLEPLLRWRSAITRLKTLAAGAPVGYGASYRTKAESMIATLPVGYADGYDRLLSNRGEVLVRGRRAPVVGRVSMDLITIDVTAIPDVQSGDEVVLLGRQEDAEITAEEMAEKTGTIAYEVFCRISRRVPRVYRSSGRIVSIGPRAGRQTTMTNRTFTT